jgi:hypothetical protein
LELVIWGSAVGFVLWARRSSTYDAADGYPRQDRAGRQAEEAFDRGETVSRSSVRLSAFNYFGWTPAGASQRIHEKRKGATSWLR